MRNLRVLRLRRLQSVEVCSPSGSCANTDALTNATTASVPAEDVIYFRAELKYITVMTANREYLIEDSLTRIDEEFGGRYLRIHRNCLARSDLIESFERDADAEGEAQ